MSAKTISNAAENKKKAAISKQTAAQPPSRPDMKAIIKSFPAQMPLYIVARRPHHLAEGAD